LIYELVDFGLIVKSQVGLPVVYRGVQLEIGFRIDVMVNDTILVEIKSIESLLDVHKKQLLTYLKLSGKKIGILVNFNVSSLVSKESLIRIIN
jgi:GxxExxY protein